MSVLGQNQLNSIQLKDLLIKQECFFKDQSFTKRVYKCCGLQIRPGEEQLKQRVIGEHYCNNRKKEVIQKQY